MLRSTELSSVYLEHNSKDNYHSWNPAELIKSVLSTILNFLNFNLIKNESTLNILVNGMMHQLDNSFKCRDFFSERIEPIIVPCIAAAASATKDFTIRKEIIYSILSRTRHSEPYVRMLAIKILVSISDVLQCSNLNYSKIIIHKFFDTLNNHKVFSIIRMEMNQKYWF